MAPLRRRSTLDSRPPCGEDHQNPLLGSPLKTSSRRRPLPLVSSVIDFGSCISLCVHGSSACTIILVGLSVLLCSPRDFPLVFPLVFFVFIVGSAPFVKDRATRVSTLHHLSCLNSFAFLTIQMFQQATKTTSVKNGFAKSHLACIIMLLISSP